MPGAEQKILDAMLWDNDGYFDGSDELGHGLNREQVLASEQGQQALARKGFTYDGLDSAQASLLDQFGGYLVLHRPCGRPTGHETMFSDAQFLSRKHRAPRC